MTKGPAKDVPFSFFFSAVLLSITFIRKFFLGTIIEEHFCKHPHTDFNGQIDFISLKGACLIASDVVHRTAFSITCVCALSCVHSTFQQHRFRLTYCCSLSL